MSYLQLEINGVKRGLKFNQMAMIILSQYTDTTDDETTLATSGYALFYAGLKANCYVKREELDLSFEESCDLFDNLKDDQIKQITEAYKETQKFLSGIDKEEKKEPGKKKVKKNTGTTV